ncbi:hypothetical protein ARTHRO9V_210179 [Arthrobacter sp. 9V]|nr:hypothetical protein ARTHRO9V_210179 [Arthrobacter sp. 9V]
MQWDGQQDQQHSDGDGQDVTDARLNRASYWNPGFQLPGKIRVLDKEFALKLLKNFALPF